MLDDQALELIVALKKVPGALSYDGDGSTQVLLPIGSGEYLRVGLTDDDVAAHSGIWFDYRTTEILTGIPLNL